MNWNEIYDFLANSVTPVTDWIANFINTYVAPGFEWLLSFLLGMGI
ncbi:MAG: hypothetical protein LBJ11_11850 [Oscillospiraceae bacterium]|jgi:hypothetical protein|nr:hypothetical protein [Oscillospiraceae bacterium]